MRPCPLSIRRGEGRRELGNHSSSLEHHSLIPQPWSSSCLGDRRRQDKGMPLATRDPYKQVSEGKEMPGCYSIPSLGIASSTFPGTGRRKIRVSHPWRVNPYLFLMTPDLFWQGTEVRV